MIARLTWSLVPRHLRMGYRKHLAVIRRVRGMDPASYRAWHESAVRRHVRWAQATIPWWRERAAPGARLEDLPVLRRRDLQEHGDRLRDPTRPVTALRRETSGGSTGEPVGLWHDGVYAAWVMATEVHFFESWGIDPWCRTAYLWGSDRAPREWPLRERVLNRLLGRRIFNAFGMGDEELRRFAEALERMQPVYIQGYASALDLMAAHLLEHEPNRRIRPMAVRSSAEVLAPDARARIEQAFGAPVYDVYGSRESACLAAQCRQGGLHVQGHGRVVEVVDDRGAPAPAGEPGRVLVTDLTNRAFGLLRYESGDVAALAPSGDCPCGCPYPRLERIHGRTGDFITTQAGERIHGEWFTHLFYGREGVERFQVHQTTLEKLHVRTVGSATEQELADILDAVRRRMGEGTQVSYERVEALETTPTGKRRFTTSDVPYDPGGGR